MSIKLISTPDRPTTIYRDENDRYYLYLASKEKQEDGSEKSIFIKKGVRFRKGVEVKNKSKLAICDGFISPYIFKVNENGEEKTIKGEKFFILDFDIVSEGTDEKELSYEARKKKYEEDHKPSKENNSALSAFNTFDDYGYGNDDELPF